MYMNIDPGTPAFDVFSKLHNQLRIAFESADADAREKASKAAMIDASFVTDLFSVLTDNTMKPEATIMVILTSIFVPPVATTVGINTHVDFFNNAPLSERTAAIILATELLGFKASLRRIGIII